MNLETSLLHVQFLDFYKLKIELENLIFICFENDTKFSVMISTIQDWTQYPLTQTGNIVD